jgi:hypothetical protein
MLVTFSCDAHENITMFGNVALRLIKMMGHTGTVPSAIVKENVPSALTHLQQSIELERQKPPPTHQKLSEDDDDDQEVSLVNRAIPLIELLEAAVKKECDVMWK